MMGAQAAQAAVPGRAYPRRALTHSSFTARELSKERRNSLSARCAPACGQRQVWGRPQGQDDVPWGRTEVLPTPLVGCSTKTHQKVTTQEPQGQRKTRELLVFPSFFFSAASPADPFPLLSTWSRPSARQSCGRRVLPRLQRGAAGSDLEVAEPAGGGKAAGLCESYLVLAMTTLSLKRRRSLFFFWPRPWATRTRSRSSGSGDARSGSCCCSGPGSSLQSRRRRA